VAEHRHYAPRRGCTEIAPNVCVRPFFRPLAPKGMVLNTPESDAYGDELAGFLVAHDRAGFDTRCEGGVTVKRGDGEPGPVWAMTGTLEGGDLTLSPSILCVYGGLATQEKCGFHGWVRNGQWVPA
jgi:hypothetical protein